MAPIKRKKEGQAGDLRQTKKPKTSVTLLVRPKEEPTFPRGGASVLTPLEHKQIQIQANQDVLFEHSTGKKAPKQGFEDDEDDDGDELPSNERNVTSTLKSKSRSKTKTRKAGDFVEEKTIKIEGLSYRRLIPGSMVLGQVSQINRHDIALSLSNNLTGYIPLTSISKTITRKVESLAEHEEASLEGREDRDDDGNDINLALMFSVGQYLRAYVMSMEEEPSPNFKSKRHISLSLIPQQANAGLKMTDLVVNSMVQAAVLSVEDHGLIMDIGLEDASIKGFMSSKELGARLEPSQIQEGAVYLCIITGQSSNGKIVKLSMDPAKVGNIKKGAYLTDAPTVDAYLPGTAVDVLISDVTASGIAGKIMGMVNVTADLIQSGSASSGKDLDKKFVAGHKIKARIICTFPMSDEGKLGVSLQDHILYWREKTVSSPNSKMSISPTQLLPLSSTIEKATVLKVEPHLGLFMDVGVKGTRGFAHISRLSDSKIDSLSSSDGLYKTGSTHKARVVGYNLMDGLFIISLERKIIDQPFLRLEDVRVGQPVKGTIEKIIVKAEGISGLLLKIAHDIIGFVPETHFSDVRLQYPERKFKEGNIIAARVLSMDSEKRQLRLTLKKTLVNSDIEPWTGYERLQPGMKAPGTLVNVLSSGSVVQFYGTVRAFLPVSEMSEAFIQDPKEHFRAGQVVNVHIVSVDAQERRMIVSCKDPSSFGEAQRQGLSELKVGELVDGVVIEKTQDTIIIALEQAGLKAFLPVEHLTDGSTAKAITAAKRIRVGQMLKELIVMRKEEAKRYVKLSSKPTLVKAAGLGQLLTMFEDVKEGDEVVGYVNNITSIGVFVQFAGELSALLLKQHLPDDAVFLPDYGMRRLQTISARVYSVDYVKQRFLLSMKPADQIPRTGDQNGAASHGLSNSVDENCTDTSDFTSGKITKARIKSIKDTQINVQLADDVQGRIDVSSVFDSWDDIENRKHPLKKFHPKEILSVRILGMHDSRNHRFLPISHRTPKAPVFELTVKQSDLNAPDLEILTLDKVNVGSSWIVYVNNVAEDCLWVNLSPNVRGRIRAMDASDNLSDLIDLNQHFPVGSAMKAKVVKVDVHNKWLDLTAKNGDSSSSLTLKDLSKGQILPGRITKVTERLVMVQLSEYVSGPLHLVDIADDYSKATPWNYTKHHIIRVCVKDIDVPNKRLTMSCRPSQVLSSSLPVEDPDLKSADEVKVNDIRRGFIKNVIDSGLFISLSSSVTAFVRVADLSDLYIKDWKSDYEVDQLVRGKVILVDATSGHIQMSLKQSLLDKNYKPPLTFNDVKVDQVVSGKVRKVEDFGVFIVIDNSANVSGLCHRSMMSDRASANPKKLYNEGDAVQAKVLSINKDKRQMSLGLKASYFNSIPNAEPEDELIVGTDVEDLDSSAAEDEDYALKGVPVTDLENNQVKDDTESVEEQDADSDVEMGRDENGGIVLGSKSGNPLSKGFSGLSTGGFDWTGGMAAFDAQDAQSEIDTEVTTPKKKKKRKAEIKIDRTGDLDANGPQSVADYERLLLGQPNSSVLWLGYMAFQLQLGEATLAREIAERALKTIHIREEDEKKNVWIALLNLENTYGSEDSLDDAFKRACQYNDSEDMHERLISIYIQSGQNPKADDLFQAALKKHTQTPGLYLNYANFLMSTQNEADRARALLPRAMQALPSHTHLNLTSKFAQLEFNSPIGEAERGRTIFETLLSQWPKRLDLWNVLLDLEIKQGDKEVVRRLFERVTGPGMKLKPRKAKFFFKRWLEYEEKVGDVKSREKVKTLAAAYVEKQAKNG